MRDRGRTARFVERVGFDAIRRDVLAFAPYIPLDSTSQNRATWKVASAPQELDFELTARKDFQSALALNTSASILWGVRDGMTIPSLTPHKLNLLESYIYQRTQVTLCGYRRSWSEFSDSLAEKAANRPTLAQARSTPSSPILRR